MEWILLTLVLVILYVTYQVISDFWYVYGHTLALCCRSDATVSCNDNRSLVVSLKNGGSHIYIDGLVIRLLVKKLTKEGIIES